MADEESRLKAYVQLLERWNERHNLTGFVRREDLLKRGIADSMAALPLLPDQGACMDVGSGAGFPGLVLAAAQPARTWTLVEPRRKRASFLIEAARVMELHNVRVLDQRLEQVHVRVRAITSRAIAGLDAEIASHLEPGGCWILAATTARADQLQNAREESPFVHDTRSLSVIDGHCWVRLALEEEVLAQRRKAAKAPKQGGGE